MHPTRSVVNSIVCVVKVHGAVSVEMANVEEARLQRMKPGIDWSMLLHIRFGLGSHHIQFPRADRRHWVARGRRTCCGFH